MFFGLGELGLTSEIVLSTTDTNVHILTESGDYLTTESGDRLAQE